MKISTVILPALAGAALVALVGCAAPTPAPAPAPAPAEPSNVSPAEPSEPTNTPVDFSCADILAAGPAGWSPASGSFTPEAGSAAADGVSLGGVACQYLDANGDVLVVAMAQPADLASVKAQVAASSSPSSALGGQEGFFVVDGDLGDADVFAGAYWISAVSSTFTVDTDASTVTQAAVQVIPAG